MQRVAVQHRAVLLHARVWRSAAPRARVAAASSHSTHAGSADEDPATKRAQAAFAQAKRHAPLYVHNDPEAVRRREVIERMLRVDHAGEWGARRICEGQFRVLRGTPMEPVVRDMLDTERYHLSVMKRLTSERRVRPTALLPLWDIAGYALGAVTAMMGKEATMAATEAIEEVIGEHYNDQLRTLHELDMGDDELRHIFKQFRDDELEHHEAAIANDSRKAPAYELLTQVIKSGCRAAIWASSRV